jgi:hypothetical protein
MRHYFPSVPGIGNVAVSRHAQERMIRDNISEVDFINVLLKSASTPTKNSVVIRESDRIRIVIELKPEPFSGAALVLTTYRVQ